VPLLFKIKYFFKVIYHKVKNRLAHTRLFCANAPWRKANLWARWRLAKKISKLTLLLTQKIIGAKFASILFFNLIFFVWWWSQWWCDGGHSDGRGGGRDGRGHDGHGGCGDHGRDGCNPDGHGHVFMVEVMNMVMVSGRGCRGC